MDYFNDIYLKRLNRYGLDYQSRIQNERQRDFENLLLKSVYRVNFDYDGESQPALLERYKQDETRTLQYLLTRRNLNLPAGTIVMIKGSNDLEPIPWMVYWLEQIEASGYNKYTLLRMTHFLKWKNRKGEKCCSHAYLFGQENNMLKDEIRSRSRKGVLYEEALKSSFFILPLTPDIHKEDYLEIGEGELLEAYRVTGYDRQSTKGVEYVTIDPTYERDKAETPKPQEGENPDDYFWLQGDDLDGST